jgi:hypothetical protein
MRAARLPTAGFALALTLAATWATAADRPPGLRRQSFDADPNWDGFRNRLTPAKPHVVRQQFGYRPTNKAGGKRPGEIGGWVQRSIAPAYYALTVEPKSLEDKLSFSGRFAVHRDESSTGTLVGFFNDTASRGWRTAHSLALRVDGNGGKFWVFFEYGTRNWMTGGMGCFEGEAYQTTKTKPFPADGTPHDFTFTYDPVGNHGGGEITLTLDGTDYRLPLADGHKAQGATFNRFGVFNQQTTGEGMDVYFDDLVVNGQSFGFDADPRWEGKGNEVEYEDRALRPLHDFGFGPTNHASGQRAGELGGLVWRDERPAYYGDAVGPFTLNDELFASGKLAFTGAGSDSGVYLGWFDSKSKRAHEESEHKRAQRNLLGVMLEGPSRVGHYFRPVYRLGNGEGAAPEDGPVVLPDGRVHEWSVRYDPRGAGGRGRITVTFDGRAQSLDLRPGEKDVATTFDRFGLVNMQVGGNHVYLYLDDLTYSAEPARVK